MIDFPINQITSTPHEYISKGHGAQTYYATDYITFDTETSHNHDEDDPRAWVYVWTAYDGTNSYYGRKMSDMIRFFDMLIAKYETNETHKLLIYVHNLPYDASYIVPYLIKAYGKTTNLLATGSRKPFVISFACGLEFRCSYKLLNDSLYRAGMKYNPKHLKLVDTIDYDKIVNQSDPLNPNELDYALTDVVTQHEIIQKVMDIYGDNVATIPLTSTGYIRRELLQEFKRDKNNYKERKKTEIDSDMYFALRREFSGGITHGNRFYKNKTITGSIGHYDLRSAYPSVLRCYKYPIGQFFHYANEVPLSRVQQDKDKYAFICEVYIKNARLRDVNNTFPYLQTSHVLYETTSGFKEISDNGRILSFYGVTKVYLSLEELEIVVNEYICDYKITKVYASYKGYIPPFLSDSIDKAFKGKSDLKAKLKQLEKDGASYEEIKNAEIDLMKAKNLLNGLYGCSSTDPVRVNYDIDEKGEYTTVKRSTDEVAEILHKFYNSRTQALRYEWGCFTTIYVRLLLHKIVRDIIGYENYIYVDTDSCFFKSTPDIVTRLESFNRGLYTESMRIGAYITTDAGEIITYNSFDDERENLKKFRFLHSKCYATEDEKGKLSVTIAGVTKDNGRHGDDVVTNADELGNIDNLTDGFIFDICGGTKAKYVAYGIGTYNGNETAGGCIISHTTKTMSCVEPIDRPNVVYGNEMYGIS